MSSTVGTYRSETGLLLSALKELLTQKYGVTATLFSPESATIKRSVIEHAIERGDLDIPWETEALRRMCRGMKLDAGLIAQVKDVSRGPDGEAKSIAAHATIVLVAESGTRDLDESGEAIPESPDSTRRRKPADDTELPPIYLAAAEKLVRRIAAGVVAAPSASAEGSSPQVGSAESLAQAARKLFLAGDYDRALAAINQASTLAKQNAGYYLLAGDIHRARGDLDSAIAEYRRTVLIDARFADGYERLARSYYQRGQRGDIDKAMEKGYRAVALGIDTEEMRLLLAHCHLNRSELFAQNGADKQAQVQRDKALEQLRGAVQVAPESRRARLEYARALREDKKLKEAVRHFREAASLGNKEPQLQKELAVLLFDAGEKPEALEALKQGVAAAKSPIEFTAKETREYRKMVSLMDAEGQDIFAEVDRAAKAFRSEGLTREKAYEQFQRLRDRADQLSRVLEGLKAPPSLSVADLHRRLAYDLLASSILQRVKFAETGDTVVDDGAAVLQSQAATEFETAVSMTTGAS